MNQLRTRYKCSTLSSPQAGQNDKRSRTERTLRTYACLDDDKRRTLMLLPAAPPSTVISNVNNEPTAAAPSGAFLAALQCDGDSDVRGHLFQFLQLADIVRLSSLSRAWRVLGVERDVRSVCASLPPHMASLHGVVSEAALGRFICKVRGFTAFLSRCTNLKTVQVAMSDFYLHPKVDKALTKLFLCLGRMGRLRILSLMNYSHNRACEEQFFNVFFSYLLSVRRGSCVFRQLDELCLRMGNNRVIKNVHRLFSAARRHAFGRLRSLTLDYQGLGPCVSREPLQHVDRGLEGMLPWTSAAAAEPEEDDVIGCLDSFPRLENLTIHGPGAGKFLEGLGRAQCRFRLRHLDVQGGSASDPSYIHLAHALCGDEDEDDGADAKTGNRRASASAPSVTTASHLRTHARTITSFPYDLPALTVLCVDAGGLWTLIPALQKGKCAKLAHLRVLFPHSDILRPIYFPTPAPLTPTPVPMSLPTTPCISSLHHLLNHRLAPLLADSRKLTNLARLKITLGRQQVWGLIRDRSAAEQLLQSAKAGGRAKSLVMELQEAFSPASVSRAPTTFSCSRHGGPHHHHQHHGHKHMTRTCTASSPPSTAAVVVASHSIYTHGHASAAAATAAALVDDTHPPPPAIDDGPVATVLGAPVASPSGGCGDGTHLPQMGGGHAHTVAQMTRVGIYGGGSGGVHDVAHMDDVL